MDNASKPNEEKPEEASEKAEDEKSEEPQSEPEAPSEKAKDEKVEESQPEDTPDEVEEPQSEAPSEEDKDKSVKEEQPKSEEKVEEKPKETSEEKEKSTEKPEKMEKEEKPVTAEVKEEIKKEEPKKKGGKKDDFKYIVRIANTDVDGEKTIVRGLTSIKGIGMHMSVLITDAAGIDRYKKVGDLTEAQIGKIKGILDDVTKNAPGWMLNHRKDYDSGEDIHLIGPDIDLRLRDEINVMKKIRSYKGIRHELGLRARGQRTRANNRKGLSLGVSKKSVQQAKSSSSKE